MGCVVLRFSWWIRSILLYTVSLSPSVSLRPAEREDFILPQDSGKSMWLWGTVHPKIKNTYIFPFVYTTIHPPSVVFAFGLSCFGDMGWRDVCLLCVMEWEGTKKRVPSSSIVFRRKHTSLKPISPKLLWAKVEVWTTRCFSFKK